MRMNTLTRISTTERLKQTLTDHTQFVIRSFQCIELLLQSANLTIGIWGNKLTTHRFPCPTLFQSHLIGTVVTSYECDCQRLCHVLLIPRKFKLLYSPQ